ncbi:hypothetical protein DFO73_101699 [Cytobacillus oceanisediminis]|uniref:Uncharacterized protein n=1 Tax=Cytobacillus oceanisediminis TaxID=665099 RepID=A0A2V3AB17_9BACI|nr:hypothetical protein DFO73_101699 [Cytobacillus oceanisediminis]
MAITILYLISSFILVCLGVISYSFSIKITNKDWRNLAQIISIVFMIYGLSNLIYLTLSRLLA